MIGLQINIITNGMMFRKEIQMPCAPETGMVIRISDYRVKLGSIEYDSDNGLFVANIASNPIPLSDTIYIWFNERGFSRIKQHENDIKSEEFVTTTNKNNVKYYGRIMQVGAVKENGIAICHGLLDDGFGYNTGFPITELEPI